MRKKNKDNEYKGLPKMETIPPMPPVKLPFVPPPSGKKNKTDYSIDVTLHNQDVANGDSVRMLVEALKLCKRHLDGMKVLSNEDLSQYIEIILKVY